MTTLRVERAALQTLDGTVWSVPRPGRHHNVIHAMAESTMPFVSRQDIGEAEQGFVLSDGRFVGRLEAMRVAIEAGQLLEGVRQNPRVGLFSENVW